jgi:hypothetical protein
MFPYLDYAVVAFVLLAGFGLGIMLGLWLKSSRDRYWYDGDGGELVPFAETVDARSPEGEQFAQVIPFRRRRAS